MNAITVPPAIVEAMQHGACLAISISGGKDSQALLNSLASLALERGWMDQVFAIHSHLGRAEWPQTLGHCECMCGQAGVPLVIVNRPQGDLVAEIRARMVKLQGTGKPFWPDASNRYCTSDQKRGQIDKVLRAPFWPDAKNRYCTSHQKTNQIDKAFRRFEVVISAEGVRADESAARAKKQALSIRPAITATSLRTLSPDLALAARKAGQRVAMTWYPLHDWNVDQVWAACGTSGPDLERRRALYKAGQIAEAMDSFPAHPAYVFGNNRLSCVFCILGSLNDLRNGAKHNPELLREYVEMERVGQSTFKNGWSLASLLEDKA